MKRFVVWVTVLVCLLAMAGCARLKSQSAVGASPMTPRERYTQEETAGATEVRPDRMLIWKADLSIRVKSVSEAVNKAVAVAEEQGGYVQEKSDQGEESGRITLRVPCRVFTAAVASLEELGTVTYRCVEGEDVTEEYIDAEARLKNNLALRDRLKQLLDQATDVKDILAIETELNRVQSDIDSMEGRIKALKGQVDFATITLDFDRKPIPGPLGYVFKGLWWGVKKLFVLRD